MNLDWGLGAYELKLVAGKACEFKLSAWGL